MIWQVEIKAYSWLSCKIQEAKTVNPRYHGLMKTFDNTLFSLLKGDRLRFERNVTRVKQIFISLDFGDDEKGAFLRALLFSLVLLFKCYSENHQKLNLIEIAFHVWFPWEVKIHQ